MTRKEVKRETICYLDLDKLQDGKQITVKVIRRFWDDGSSCLQLTKYIELEDGSKRAYYPPQYLQIPWDQRESFAAFLHLYMENDT